MKSFVFVTDQCGGSRNCKFLRRDTDPVSFGSRRGTSAVEKKSSFCLYTGCHLSVCFLLALANMILKEYRICMPMTVEEYHIGQLYMISKHSHDQSEQGEGVHVVKNEPCEDEKHGKGQFTEKRVYLSSRLPGWMRSYIPKIFYVEEKAWNYYPYTITEYCCSFLPRFSIRIRTKYYNDNGGIENCFELDEETLESREVVDVDIAYDELPEKHYVPEEDCRYFKSKKTGRGPLKEGWKDDTQPIMCSYKLVSVSFDVWALASRVESYVHKVIQDILLLGHRQAFAWIDDWIGMTIDDVRDYEKVMQEKTNDKVAADI